MGLLVNKRIGRVPFVKELVSGRVIQELEERSGGMGKNSRPLPPPLTGKQGRGGATPTAPEAGGLGLDGASGGGENREEEVGVRFPYLARAGVEQGGRATRSGGSSIRRLWQWR